MQAIQFRPGRMIRSLDETVVPNHLSSDQENVDMTKPGEISRRAGSQHALTDQFTGEISLVAKWEDYDGTEVYIVIDEATVSRNT